MGSEVGCSLWWRRGLFRSADERRTRVRYSLPSMFFCNIMRRYCGIGGMHTLPRSILAGCAQSAVSVRVGVRVSSIEPCDGSARWALYGVGGAAACHDSAEELAQASHSALLGHFDIVHHLLHAVLRHSRDACACTCHRYLGVLCSLAPSQCRSSRKFGCARA